MCSWALASFSASFAHTSTHTRTHTLTHFTPTHTLYTHTHSYTLYTHANTHNTHTHTHTHTHTCTHTLQRSLEDADVACRMLGFKSAASAPKRAAFGPGNGTIWLDDLLCFGTETTLLECSHSGLRVHNCRHSEDASAVCWSELPTDHRLEPYSNPQQLFQRILSNCQRFNPQQLFHSSSNSNEFHQTANVLSAV